MTDVGAYTGTTSPYGAYDMGGDVWQWNDTFIGGAYFLHGIGFDGPAYLMYSSASGEAIPQAYSANTGFRLVMVPEPSSIVLAIFGFAGALSLRKRLS